MGAFQIASQSAAVVKVVGRKGGQTPASLNVRMVAEIIGLLDAA